MGVRAVLDLCSLLGSVIDCLCPSDCFASLPAVLMRDCHSKQHQMLGPECHDKA